MKAHTQRTDAILNSQPNDGFGLEKKQCIAQWYDHSAKIESENAELRAALEQFMMATENGVKGGIVNMSDLLSRCEFYSRIETVRNQARAILERTKK